MNQVSSRAASLFRSFRLIMENLMNTESGPSCLLYFPSENEV